MENSNKYPLEQLQLIKKKRMDEAEKILREKKEALAKEEEKLKAVERDRDKVKTHKDEKLNQLREALDLGGKSTKITQMKDYLKIVQEDLKKHEIKVRDQKKKVDAAEKEVETARANYIRKLQDVEKLQEHEKEWQKEKLVEREHRESIEADEMGASKHILRKYERKGKSESNRKKR